MMEATTQKRPRIRAIPKEPGRLLTIAASLFIFSGLWGLLLSQQVLKFPASISTALGTNWLPPLSLLSSIFIAATGISILLGAKRRGFYYAAVIALPVAMSLFYGRYDAASFPVLASLLPVLSAIGWRWNVVFARLPEKHKLPLLNVLSAATAFFFAPEVLRALNLHIKLAGLSPWRIYLAAFVALLPSVGLLLFNLAMAPQNAEASGPARNIKAVPRNGLPFTVAAYVLLAGGIGKLLITLTSAYNVDALLLVLPLLAAGILIATGKGGEKRFFAGAVCLVLRAAPAIFRAASYESLAFWTYAVPLFLMFISAVGVLRNAAPKALSRLTRAPILSILAAALLLTNVALTTTNTLKRNAAAAETRDKAFMTAAADAGDAASAARDGLKRSEEAIDAFNETVGTFYVILELAMPQLSSSSVEGVLADIEELSANVKEAEKAAAPAASPFEKAASAFETHISELSAEAAAEYLDIANAPPKPSSSSSATAAPAPAQPVDLPTPEDIESGLVDAVDAANEAMRAVYAAESAARTAAGNAEFACEMAVLSITHAETATIVAVQDAKAAMVSWYILLLNLLPSAGLALLNLSLDTRVLESKGMMAALAALCRRIYRWFYRDVGGKLQTLAKIQGIVCAALACLSALVAAVGLCGLVIEYFFTGMGYDYLMVLITGGAGVLASFILALPSWTLYAYGQITADLRDVKGSKNPDNLPEI